MATPPLPGAVAVAAIVSRLENGIWRYYTICVSPTLCLHRIFGSLECTERFNGSAAFAVSPPLGSAASSGCPPQSPFAPIGRMAAVMQWRSLRIPRPTMSAAWHAALPGRFIRCPRRHPASAASPLSGKRNVVRAILSATKKKGRTNDMGKHSTKQAAHAQTCGICSRRSGRSLCAPRSTSCLQSTDGHRHEVAQGGVSGI